MMAVPILAACLAVPAASEHVVAGDLAPAVAAFAGLPADTPLAWAPEPGAPRIFRAAELRLLAARFGATPVPDADLCVERPTAPLARERLQAALEAQVHNVRLEVVDFSRQPAPDGTLVFPLEGLRRGSGTSTWTGYVRYAGSRRFAVWARVRARAPVVVAVSDLRPGRPIAASQLRLETRDGFPQTGAIAALEEAVGKLARHSIRAGTALLAAGLEAAPDVSRGDLVKVEVWSGAARLGLEARAENAASAGERVALRNPLSGQRFFARVDAPGRVSIGRGHP